MLALILTASEARGGQQRNGAGFRCEEGTEDFWRAGGGGLLEVPRPIEAGWSAGQPQLEQHGCAARAEAVTARTLRGHSHRLEDHRHFA